MYIIGLGGDITTIKRSASTILNIEYKVGLNQFMLGLPAPENIIKILTNFELSMNANI